MAIAGVASLWRRHWAWFIPFSAVFLLLFVPAAIRYGIGTDYFYTYVPGLDIVASTGENAQWEIGFLAICKAVLYLDLPDQWMFGIASFLTCALALAAFPRRGFAWCILGFVVAMYLPSYNVVRQELSVAVCLFAFSLHLRRKEALAIVVFVSAMLFHTSVIILFPLVVIAECALRFQAKVIIGMGAVFAIVILVCHPLDVFMRVISFVPVAESYLSYENSDGYMGSGVANSGLGFLSWYVVWLVQGFFLLLKSKSRQGREIGVWCLMALLVKIVGSQVNIFARVSLATDAVLPFSLSLMPRRVRTLTEKLAFAGVVLLLLILFFHDYGFNSNVHGSGEVLPYRTIFD